jgi:hypothetical protein
LVGGARRDRRQSSTGAGSQTRRTYLGDSEPGDDAGQGLDQFGAKWYVLSADGAKIDTP